MKVKDVMIRPVLACTVETDLATAARIMKNNNCDALAVLDHFGRGRVIGLITDRDISMAVMRCHRGAAEMLVWEAATHGVRACAPDDEVGSALAMMKAYQVRRLPVVNEAGLLQGILSIDDLTRKGASQESPPGSQILRTLKSIRTPQGA